ncbi:hypothetical protein M9458_004871, partial [Cirrhinus mrigala]
MPLCSTQRGSYGVSIVLKLVGRYDGQCGPVLHPLFEDPLVGEEDDDDKILLTILEDEDDGDKDATFPPNQFRPQSMQDESSPSPVQVDTDLLQVCRKAMAKL